MNISVTFHIIVDAHPRPFRMLVEHFYTSEQVDRFKIHGKGRHLILEKRHTIKRHPWKVVEGVFDTTRQQEIAMAVLRMQGAIDKYLEKRNPDITSGYFIPPK